MSRNRGPIEWYRVKYSDGSTERLRVFAEGTDLVIRDSHGMEHEVPSGASIRHELELHWDVEIVESGVY